MSTQCWACHKTEMEETPEVGKDWGKCANCGATFNYNPTQIKTKKGSKK